MNTIQANTVTLRLRPPGSTTWTTLANDHTDPTRALPIDTVEISWSSPGPRDHPDPATLDLDILIAPDSPEVALLARDTDVELTAGVTIINAAGNAQAAGGTLFRGWIDSWIRTTHHDGRHRYRLSIIDALGRAAAINLASSPWPASTQLARIDAINAASPIGPLLARASLPGRVGPRDVDNASALSVIQDTAYLGQRAEPGRTIDHDGLIGLYWPPVSAPSYFDGELWMSPYMYLVTLPADLLEDTGRAMNRTGALNQASAEYFPTPAAVDTTTTTHRIPGSSYSTSSWSIGTDTVPVVADVERWLTAIVHESNTAAHPLLQPGRLILDTPVAVPAIWYLLDHNTRNRAILKLRYAPGDIDTLQAVTAGTLTINGLTLTLTLTLTPARLFGVRPLRFSDLPLDATRPRLKIANPLSDSRVRFSDTSTATIPPPARQE